MEKALIYKHIPFVEDPYIFAKNVAYVAALAHAICATVRCLSDNTAMLSTKYVELYVTVSEGPLYNWRGACAEEGALADRINDRHRHMGRVVENMTSCIISSLRDRILSINTGVPSGAGLRYKKQNTPALPGIKNVHFSGPVTCVIWSDGTKTLVRCKDGEQLDPEKGLAMAIAKKFLGTNKSDSNYYDAFKQWLPKHSAADHDDGDGGFIEVAFPEDPTRDNKKSDAEDEVETNPDNPSRGMTCREKLALEHPECVDETATGGCSGCPSDYGYIPNPEVCMCFDAYCRKCWDRVIPGTSTESETE